MKQIFLNLSLYITSKVPEIQIVELDNGALLLGNIPLQLPAAFISFAYQDGEQADEQSHICSLTIAIKVAFDCSASQTSSLTPTPWREKSLSMLDTVDNLDRWLRHFDNPQVSTPELRSITQDYINPSITVYTLTYVCYGERV